MANSYFKKEGREITVPVSVKNGGTGRSSLNSKSVLLGVGTGNVTMLPPGVSGNALVSDGASWTSGPVAPADSSVTYAKLATDLVNSTTISLVNIDWSTSSIFTKMITNNTSFTFSNYQLNKSITLILNGNYTVSLPKSVKVVSGVYDGWTKNYITLHCTKTTAPQEVLAVINGKYYNLPTGYFAGGATGSYVATSDRIVFSTGVTSANTVSNLSQARYGLAGLSDLSNYGYFAGGVTNTSVVNSDRIVFSTGVTSANTVSNLSQARYNVAGLSDGINYGYFSGGFTVSYFATTERIVFSTGVTSANTVSNLSQARSATTGSSDAITYGYFVGGGNTSGNVTTTDRIVFSTGVTSANTVSNLSQARSASANSSDSIAGYFAGGTTGGIVATTERIVFSTGVTSANTVSNLSQARSDAAGLSDGGTNGYFDGGYTGSIVAVKTADRIVFSTGVTSANTVSNLSQARYGLVGLSSRAV